jgi:hypothetical protein
VIDMLATAVMMGMHSDPAWFQVTEATVRNWFSVRGINITLAQEGDLTSVGGAQGAVIGAQPAGALLSFPDTVVWNLYAEGSFVFLDGGTLDLGAVRSASTKPNQRCRDLLGVVRSRRQTRRRGTRRHVDTVRLGCIGRYRNTDVLRIVTRAAAGAPPNQRGTGVAALAQSGHLE